MSSRGSDFTQARPVVALALLLAAPAALGLSPSVAHERQPHLGHVEPFLAFIRSGDVWLRSPGGRQRRITRDGNCDGLSASAGGRLAWTSGERQGSLYVLEAPGSVPRRVAAVAYTGTPCWLPGERTLLTTREALRSDAGDEGLWRVDLDTGSVRQVLPATDADASMFTSGRLSPSGTRTVLWGTITAWSQVTVFDVKAGRSWSALGAAGVHSLGEVAWLDDDRILIAGTAENIQEKGVGGIRVYDLRTRKTSPWLFSSTTPVTQLVRSPRRSRFAIGLAERPGSEAVSVAIVDALPRPQLVRKLKVPGLPRIAEFSRDGRSLLVLSGLQDVERADAWEVDVATGRRHRLVRNVSEAVWLH